MKIIFYILSSSIFLLLSCTETVDKQENKILLINSFKNGNKYSEEWLKKYENTEIYEKDTALALNLIRENLMLNKKVDSLSNFIDEYEYLFILAELDSHVKEISEKIQITTNNQDQLLSELIKWLDNLPEIEPEHFFIDEISRDNEFYWKDIIDMNSYIPQYRNYFRVSTGEGVLYSDLNMKNIMSEIPEYLKEDEKNFINAYVKAYDRKPWYVEGTYLNLSKKELLDMAILFGDLYNKQKEKAYFNIIESYYNELVYNLFTCPYKSEFQYFYDYHETEEYTEEYVSFLKTIVTTTPNNHLSSDINFFLNLLEKNTREKSEEVNNFIEQFNSY